MKGKEKQKHIISCQKYDFNILKGAFRDDVWLVASNLSCTLSVTKM